jgi:hypothetical protein
MTTIVFDFYKIHQQLVAKVSVDYRYDDGSIIQAHIEKCDLCQYVKW